MADPLSIVVLISGNGSNLQAIIDKVHNDPSIPASVTAVISNRADAYGLERAQQQQIQTHVLSHKEYADRQSYDSALLQLFKKHQADLVVLAGFMRILGKEVVEHYPGKMINIHPSLLPKYRGLHTHEQVIANGDDEHGMSIHFVTAELDGGPVICQARFAVTSQDNLESIKQKVHHLEHEYYPMVVQWIAQGRLLLSNEHVQLDGQSVSPYGKQFTH